MRKFAFRLVEIFDYRTFLVAGAFATLLLVGYLIVGAIQSAHDANLASNQRGKAATRRIDLLTQQGQERDRRIEQLVKTIAQQQTAQDALSEQIRRMGGQPIVVVRSAGSTSVVVSSSPTPRPSPATRPQPTSSPSSRPTNKPRPSPSPTCRPLPILGCRGAR